MGLSEFKYVCFSWELKNYESVVILFDIALMKLKTNKKCILIEIDFKSQNS